MASTIPRSQIEVCPLCGNFVEQLNAKTGFCISCSPPECLRCGGVPNKDHNLCIKCQRELWLERNADEIEYLMAQGHGFVEAKQKINDENRAICISCSEPIPGRSRQTTIFCTRKERCRKARQRYIWKTRKGIPQDIALEEVLEHLLRERS